jgi:sulfate transport system substrate-binding protein
MVTTNVAKHHTEVAARAYLSFLFSDDAQELLAEDGYRPENDAVLSRHPDLLPRMTLFPVTTIARDWNNAQEKFFGDNGIFTAVHTGTN